MVWPDRQQIRFYWYSQFRLSFSSSCTFIPLHHSLIIYISDELIFILRHHHSPLVFTATLTISFISYLPLISLPWYISLHHPSSFTLHSIPLHPFIYVYYALSLFILLCAAYLTTLVPPLSPLLPYRASSFIFTASLYICVTCSLSLFLLSCAAYLATLLPPLAPYCFLRFGCKLPLQWIETAACYVRETDDNFPSLPSSLRAFNCSALHAGTPPPNTCAIT